MALKGKGGRRSSSAADSSSSNNNNNNNNNNNTQSVTSSTGNVQTSAGDLTFGGGDPRNKQPSYNPNLLGQYVGYYNPDYAPAPGTITTPSAVGDVSSTPFPVTEISDDVSSGYSPIGSNPSNNFFSGIGSGISNLASNFNMGNVMGSAIGNMIAPGIGGLLGGYIGNTYGDDDPSNNFFGNLGKNLQTDFGDTVDFFSPDVKAIDPSLDTSGLTIDDLTGSEITDTVDPVNEIGLGTLYGPKVTDLLYQDPNALPDNPMYGPDELQRMAGGNTYGAIGSSPISSVEQDDTPKPMSYGDLNIYQSGPVPGLTLTNEQDQLNKEAMEKLIGEVTDKYSGTKNFFQDPNATFRTITPGVMRDSYNVNDPDAISYKDYESAIADMRARGEDSYIAGRYTPGYNVAGDPSLSDRNLAALGPETYPDAFATGYTDQSARNMLLGPQEKPTYDFGNVISMLNNPNDPYDMAQTALEEAFHYDSANSPMPNKKGESYDFDTGEETMIKEMLGTPNSFEHLAELGYRQDAIGRPSLSELSTEQDQQDFAQFLDQFGFTQRPTKDTYTNIPSFYGFNQGGRVPPMSGPMSNGLGNLFKMK